LKKKFERFEEKKVFFNFIKSGVIHQKQPYTKVIKEISGGEQSYRAQQGPPTTLHLLDSGLKLKI